MKAKEIKVGGHYLARVGNNLTTVRVDRIADRRALGISRRASQSYYVTNLATGRTTMFRSAQKFRREAKPADFVEVRRQTGRKTTQAEIDRVNVEAAGVVLDPLTALPVPVNRPVTRGDAAKNGKFVERYGRQGEADPRPFSRRPRRPSAMPPPSSQSAAPASPSTIPRPSTASPATTSLPSSPAGAAAPPAGPGPERRPLRKLFEKTGTMGWWQERFSRMTAGAVKAALPRDNRLVRLYGLLSRHHDTLVDDLVAAVPEPEPTDNQEIERLEAAVRQGGEQGPDPTTSHTSVPTAILTPKIATVTTPSSVTQEAAPATNGSAGEPEAEGLKGDQLRAFEEVTARLGAKQIVTKLVGYAGSGKTFLLARIANWAVRKGFEVTVAAPTHKAAGVIKDKLGDSRIQVRTIHSLLGLRLEPDWESDSGGRILQAADSKSKVKRGLVICDEASMVGETLKEHIDKTAGVSWLFVGDLAQLPPVGESISKMLSDPDATLEQVLRQAQGSEILNLATRIRRGDQSMEFERGKDVYRVGSAEDLFQAALKRFDSDEYRKDASHTRMLVFKNRRREALNRRMRSLLVNAGPDEPYVPGEWLVMYAQFSPEKSRLNLLAEKAKQYKKGEWGYGRSWKEFFNYRDTVGQAVTQLHVSEEVLVGAVGKGRVEVGSWAFNVWKLQVTTKGGGCYELPVLMDDSKDLYTEVLKEQVEEAQNCRQARDQYGKGSPEWLRFDESRKKAWGVYFTLEELFAQVDYAYAMTVHKSQGSTFDHVFCDIPDLMTAGGMVQRILYTAVTRPAKSLTFYA